MKAKFMKNRDTDLIERSKTRSDNDDAKKKDGFFNKDAAGRAKMEKGFADKRTAMQGK